MGLFADLLAHPGVEELVELRGRVGFMAYHGGSLEEMTDVIAREAAARSGSSYYGVHQPPDLQWHIPSTMVSPDDSPALARFVEHVETVITVHGYGREGYFTTLLLGGGNRLLAEHVAVHLRSSLPMYEIATDLDRIPPALRGQHPDNPVNLPRRQGVQIELPPRVRGAGPRWKDWAGPGLVPHTRSLIDGLTAAASSWALGPDVGPAV